MTAENEANPVVGAMLRRRSVREGFTNQPVSLEVIEDIVRCGLAAPSSKNARPWRFHVVTDVNLLAEISNAVALGEGFEKYVPFDPATGEPRPEYSSSVAESASILRHVRLAIFIENAGPFSGGREALTAATPQALADSLVGYTFEVIGIGAALQNMWLAAVSHGLCGVFLGDVLIAEGAIRKRLSIDADLIGILALGFAREPGSRPVSQHAVDSLRVVWHP